MVPPVHSAALPFTVTRSDDAIGAGTMRSTVERVHGLLRATSTQLVVQWRSVRQTDVFGPEIRSEETVGDIREVSIPIEALGAVAVRHPWPSWWRRPLLVLTASDLRAFELLVGAEGLERTHPAELTLVLRRGDGAAAEGFAAEVMLAIAERALGAAEERALLGAKTPPAP
jgi:hypothetical protein